MFKSIYTIALVIVVTFSLTGCLGPTPEKTSVKEAQELADSLMFVKSNKGICFGVGTVSRMSTNATVAMNNVMVTVDCKAVGF